MTFGPNHYVPILKVKRGEKAALGRVATVLRPRITPVLEIVERTPDKVLEQHLTTAFKNLADSLYGYPRCFLDVREIAPDGSAAAAAAFERAVHAGIAFTPVTGITRTVDVAAALSHQDRGLALRLTRSELNDDDLSSRLDSFLEDHQIAAATIDLIVDLGAVENLIGAGIGALANECLTNVPSHDSWRTLTVSACAFPASMGGISRHSHQLVERADWTAWRDYLYAFRSSLARLPSFGDCAIQHPQGVEGFNPIMMQVSASVRYTIEENWLLIKGESTRFNPPSFQFPELATRLVYGHLNQYFAGPEHCAGCQSMKAAADGTSGYGSAEAWRRLGTIHHISQVMQGLDSLAWP